jgi:hypothetical protein
MSLKILLDDQIAKLFNDNPELKTVNKNHFRSQLPLLLI